MSESWGSNSYSGFGVGNCSSQSRSMMTIYHTCQYVSTTIVAQSRMLGFRSSNLAQGAQNIPWQLVPSNPWWKLRNIGSDSIWSILSSSSSACQLCSKTESQANPMQYLLSTIGFSAGVLLKDTTHKLIGLSISR